MFGLVACREVPETGVFLVIAALRLNSGRAAEVAGALRTLQQQPVNCSNSLMGRLFCLGFFNSARRRGDASMCEGACRREEMLPINVTARIIGMCEGACRREEMLPINVTARIIGP